MVSNSPLISKSSSSFIKALVTLPSVPITIGITVTIMFYSFFISLASSRYLSFAFFQFYPVVNGNSKVHNSVGSNFLLTITRPGRLAWIRGSVCISKSQRSFCVSFFRTDSELYVYHLFLKSNLSFLHNSQWITFPTQSCLV